MCNISRFSNQSEPSSAFPEKYVFFKYKYNIKENIKENKFKKYKKIRKNTPVFSINLRHSGHPKNYVLKF